jgi:gamma-glutamyltranspeptidase/glutathione hydrolase
MPDVLLVENGFNKEVAGDLDGKGHQVEWMRSGLSAVQGVVRRGDGRFEAVGETRQVNSGGYSI